MFLWLRLSAVVLLLVLLSGCLPIAEGPQDEARNPYIVTGRERFKGRDYKGAIEAYEKALEVNPRSVTAHFELGVIYEQFENDYPAAIYHYNQVLKLRPDGAYPADNARQRIPGCRQEMLKADGLATINPAGLRETERLRDENTELKKQIDFLQGRMASLQTQLNAANAQLAHRQAAPAGRAIPSNQGVRPAPSRQPTSASPPAPPDYRSVSPAQIQSRSPAPNPAPAAPRTYLVKRGDTFASIARRYGFSMQALMRANPVVEPRRLQVGQRINLPPAD